MTMINRVGPLPPSRPGARTGGGTAAGFLPPAAPGPDASRAEGVALAAPVALDSLLALQQVDEPAERDRAARRHGHALLAALGRLQRALLEHGDEAAALGQIRGLAEAAPAAAADPGLAASVDLVVLRARIELARRNG
ncbi:MAG TPA: flagellar assembly protein FliX [Acetobacteraceae bacterium]|nr:flagellar assembly protein FliX [Acetobacteraceae bacterium]